MSKIKTVLVTEVPEFFQLKPDGTVAREMSEKGGFTCPRCNGAGRIIVEDNLRYSIYDDGVNCEDSLSYCHFIARLYLEAVGKKLDRAEMNRDGD